MSLKAQLRGGVRRFGAGAVKAAAAGLDRVSPPEPGLTILIYHRVGGGSGSAVDVPVPLFREQMQWLAANTTVVSLDDAVPRLGDPAAGPAVVVTFDDGTSDWVDHAMPVLAEAGVPATFYVATSFVEDGRPWPSMARAVSWAGLADMASTGLATIGSHTHSHALLDRITGDVADFEVARSSGLIEERLGLACKHFAYPKALLGSDQAQASVRERFVTATLAGGRTNVAGHSDLHRLSRTPVQTGDAMTWFRAKSGGGLRLEGAVRDRLDRRRYVGRSS